MGTTEHWRSEAFVSMCVIGLTWELACVPDDDGVVHAAGRQPHIMRRPGHIHHIWEENTQTH